MRATNTCKFKVMASLYVLLPVVVGCGSIQKSAESDFLKPLATSGPAQSLNRQGSMPSERSLCVETAKTVAEQGHAAEAIALYERAEELDPNAPLLDAELAPLYASVSDHSSAIERYRRCVQKSPSDLGLSNNLAWTLMEAGQFELAINEARRALQNDPDHVRLRTTLAVIHYRRGERNEALKNFEQAYGLEAAHHNLAILDIDAGEVATARAHLRLATQTTKLDPKTELVLSALNSPSRQR